MKSSYTKLRKNEIVYFKFLFESSDLIFIHFFNSSVIIEYLTIILYVKYNNKWSVRHYELSS